MDRWNEFNSVFKAETAFADYITVHSYDCEIYNISTALTDLFTFYGFYIKLKK